LQTVADVAGDGVNGFRLGQQAAVGRLDGVAHLGAVGAIVHVAERVAPQVVGGAVLVQQPEHFIG